MIVFKTTLKQFGAQGEKTGWTYIEVPAALATKLKPGQKKGFRVKGRLDEHPIAGVSLLPMGAGNFILAVNAGMRKALRKKKGAAVQVHLEADDKPVEILPALMESLHDEPDALAFFQSLPRGHQQYFSKWIESAKTDPTRDKRIAMTVSAAARGWRFNEMLRAQRKSP